MDTDESSAPGSRPFATDVTDAVAADRLASIGIFRGLDETSRTALADELRLVRLAAGRTLFRQGDEAESVFVVLEGRLAVYLDSEGATPRPERENGQLLSEMRPGDVVGEVALVAGGKRSATVRALEDATLAKLSVATLERLLAEHADIASHMVELVTRRLRRSQLATQLSNLFEGLDAAALAEIEDAVEWVSLPAGQRLYGEGDPGDAAYLVVSGRVRVVTRDAGERLLHEVSRGDMIGESSLVEDRPRSESVYAARDTDLARLPRVVFESLIDRHPRAMLGVVRAVFRRVRASSLAPSRSLGADLSICVLPARRGVDLDGFVTDLVEALAKHGRTARLDPKRIDALLGKPGIAVSRSSEPGHIRLVQFLHEIEDEHRFVVYQAEPTWTEWTGRAIRQADYVLTVGVAGADPSPSQTERHIETYRKTQHPRWGLVLLQPADTTRPEGTRPWLDAREGVEEVFHLRRHHRPDLERLVRILSGRAVGVVFGGGGARGFAHLGVLRALEELGIPVDVVGGTSMGAPMAACAARGMTAAEALDEAREGYRSLLDYTLPFVSVISGAGITGSITRSLGAWNIEDLWLPYFCVSTNITRAAPVVHRRGSLHRAVRASVAIPGVLPPVPENGELLVDGGVLNNLPIDVMRELNPTGPVIAVDVVPNRGPAAPSDYGLAVSGWQVALGRLLPSRRMDVPGIGATMLRSMLVGADNARRQQVAAGLCDLYLNVQMRGIGMLDFDAVEPVAQIGYEQGLEALRTWVDGGGLA